MPTTRSIAAVYDYCDEADRLLFQVVRYDPKDFRQRRPDGKGGWIWGRDGVHAVPYRLPDLIRRVGPIFVCEGEKDVDTLISHGLIATTLPGGAGALWRDEYAKSFANRDVMLLPDNDDAGRTLMGRIAAGLRDHPTLYLLQLPDLPLKGDVTDWFAQPGNTRDRFLQLAFAAAQSRRRDSPDLIRLAEVPPQRVSWLWRPWLPVGKLCMIDGDPGQGKSCVTLDLAARLSRGDNFPDGSAGPGQPVATLLISCEDGLADTVVPRLEALGANLDFIHGYQGELKDGKPFRLPQLPDDMPALEAIVRESGAKLIVIDPLMAFLGPSINSISDQSVRQALTPLATLAERLGVTVLFVRHLNKSNGKQAVYRGGGSIGIVAAMRTAMLIARHPHDRDQRVLAMVKCNLGPEPQSIAFRLQASNLVPEGTEVKWEGAVDLLANDLVGDVKDKLTPKEWLRNEMTTGPKSVVELQAGAAADGISERTLDRAKAALGLVAKKRRLPDGTDGWWWLPPGTADFPSESLPPLELGLYGPLPAKKSKKSGPYADRY